MSERIKDTARWIRKRIPDNFDAAIILGSGLSHLADQIEIKHQIPYREIPGFPISTVEGHEGILVAGSFAGLNVLALKGRFHFYEGYPMAEVVYPIRVFHQLGIRLLVLSNAAGGMNPLFHVGDIMVITDHINLMGTNPLIGKNDDEFGPRFPDMSQVYDINLRKMILEAGRAKNIPLQQGVYAGVTGPTYETPAEYRYIRIVGADAVGMSTVPEAIVAKHAGMKILALSVITDLGIEGKIHEISHQEVLTAASLAEPSITSLLKEVFSELKKNQNL
jgi:purine-nucleoside phosphorylase